MHVNRITSFTAALLGLLPLAWADSTTPVGFNTVQTIANSDTIIGVPFHPGETFLFTVGSASAPYVVDDVTVGDITITGTMTAGAFDGSTPSNPEYFLRVKDGDREGMWYHIGANTTDTFTVITADDPDFATLDDAASVMVEAIPYWTLDTLIPNGGDLTASTILSSDHNGDSIFFIRAEGDQGFSRSASGGLELVASSEFFYYDGTAGGDAGWYDADGALTTPEGDVPFAPDSIFIIRAVADGSITLSGTVPSANQAFILALSQTSANEDNFFPNPYPIPISLQQTGLSSSSFFAESTSLLAPDGDIVLVYNRITDPADANIDRPADAVYLYYAGGETHPAFSGFGVGWYDGNDIGAGPISDTFKPIPASGGFGVRKRPTGSTGSGVVQTALPYTP